VLAGDASPMIWLGLMRTPERELPRRHGYRRVAVPSGPECWRRAPVGPPMAENLIPIVWPVAEESWGDVRGFGVFLSDDPDEPPVFAAPLPYGEADGDWDDPDYAQCVSRGRRVICRAGWLEVDARSFELPWYVRPPAS